MGTLGWGRGRIGVKLNLGVGVGEARDPFSPPWIDIGQENFRLGIVVWA